jgi:hypothetical protein
VVDIEAFFVSPASVLSKEISGEGEQPGSKVSVICAAVFESLDIEQVRNSRPRSTGNGCNRSASLKLHLLGGCRRATVARARVTTVQMDWLWLWYQSKSELSLWYYRRVGDLKGRVWAETVRGRGRSAAR